MRGAVFPHRPPPQKQKDQQLQERQLTILEEEYIDPPQIRQKEDGILQYKDLKELHGGFPENPAPKNSNLLSHCRGYKSKLCMFLQIKYNKFKMVEQQEGR